MFNGIVLGEYKLSAQGHPYVLSIANVLPQPLPSSSSPSPSHADARHPRRETQNARVFYAPCWSRIFVTPADSSLHARAHPHYMEAVKDVFRASPLGRRGGGDECEIMRAHCAASCNVLHTRICTHVRVPGDPCKRASPPPPYVVAGPDLYRFPLCVCACGLACPCSGPVGGAPVFMHT